MVNTVVHLGTEYTFYMASSTILSIWKLHRPIKVRKSVLTSEVDLHNDGANTPKLVWHFHALLTNLCGTTQTPQLD